MNIIFLDIDGVIVTHRSSFKGVRRPDSTACDMIVSLCTDYNAKIVISSVWRKQSLENIISAYNHQCWQKLYTFLHTNWRTSDSNTSFRGDEIKEWLDHNQVDNYIIFDDDSDFQDARKSHLILTNGYNGISFGNYMQAVEILSGHNQQLFKQLNEWK